MRKFGIAAFCLIGFAGSSLGATFVVGSTVGTVSNIATFDNVQTGQDLSAYSEDGMNVTVAKDAFTGWYLFPNFSGNFFYPDGGANGANHISLVGGGSFAACDWNMGSGYVLNGDPNCYFHVWAYNGASLVGEASGFTAMGDQVGFYDAAGMTDIYVGVYANLGTAQDALVASFQAAAMDNVRIGSASAVPEPTSMAALGLGIAALARKRRKLA
ncbi:MAG: PEP-CTERM sorting domain-containing protein [Armatimonadetes bacterium]|nr:PEP-CTERM sorting domain-containing protein [Armatimonadota bacterium]